MLPEAIARCITSDPKRPTPQFSNAHRSMWRSARAAAILHSMPAFFSRESGRACRCAHFTDSRSPPAAASSASLPLAIAAIRKRLQHRTQLASASNRTASCTSCSSSSDRLSSMLWREERRPDCAAGPRRSAKRSARAEDGAGEKTPDRHVHYRTNKVHKTLVWLLVCSREVRLGSQPAVLRQRPRRTVHSTNQVDKAGASQLLALWPALLAPLPAAELSVRCSYPSGYDGGCAPHSVVLGQ